MWNKCAGLQVSADTGFKRHSPPGAVSKGGVEKQWPREESSLAGRWGVNYFARAAGRAPGDLRKREAGGRGA